MVRPFLCCLVLVSALFGSAVNAEEPEVETKVVLPKQEGEPIRVETRAGTFEAANPKAAELVRKAIAGDEKLSTTVYARTDVH